MDDPISYDTRKRTARIGVCAVVAGLACVLQVPIFFFRSQIVSCLAEIAPWLTRPDFAGRRFLYPWLSSGIVLLPSIAAVILAFAALAWEKKRPESRIVALMCGGIGMMWIFMRVWGAVTEHFGWWSWHTPFWTVW